MRHATITLAGMAMLLGSLPAIAATSRAAPRTGDFGGELTDPETNVAHMRYVARVPKKILTARTRASLIVLLHGIGGNENGMMGAASTMLSSAGRSDEYILIGMKSKGRGWEDVDHEPIRKTVAWALSTYPIDPSRVFALGYSHGAIRLGVLGAKAQDLFAGVIIWAGMCRNVPEQADPANTGLQYYIVHGEKDPTVGPGSIRTAVKKMADLGVRHVYHEIAGGDHGAPSAAGARKHLWADTIRWADAIRNRNTPLSDADAKLVETMSGKLNAGKQVSTRDISRLGGLDGPRVTALLAQLLGHTSSGIRYAAVRICESRYFGPAVTNVLVEMAGDTDARIRKAALEALWKAAGWNCPEAIDAIAAMATDTEARLSARAAAITILKAIRMPAGFVSNPNEKIEAAFRALAEDKSSRVRAFAAAQ